MFETYDRKSLQKKLIHKKQIISSNYRLSLCLKIKTFYFSNFLDKFLLHILKIEQINSANP